MSRSNDEDPNPAALLESKIQSAAALYRRERDEAHRAHELASEKLKLAVDDANAADRTLQALQSKLQELQRELESQAESNALQQEVEQLNLQVAFQHAELLKMREKLQGHLRKGKSDEASRDNARAKLQGALAPRRRRVAQLLDAEAEEWKEDRDDREGGEGVMEALREEVRADDAYDRHLWRTGAWPRLIHAAAQQWELRAERVNQEVRTLERILEGYCRHLPQFYWEEDAEEAEATAEDPTGPPNTATTLHRPPIGDASAATGRSPATAAAAASQADVVDGVAIETTVP